MTNSFVFGTFGLYYFMERKYFSAEQSYSYRQCNFMANRDEFTKYINHFVPLTDTDIK